MIYTPVGIGISFRFGLLGIAEGIRQEKIANLLHLIRLGFPLFRLDVQDFGQIVVGEYVMTPPDTNFEAERL